LGSGGFAGGSRFDPPHNVRLLQQALWLKELVDFGRGAMHDRVDDNGAVRPAGRSGSRTAARNLLRRFSVVPSTFPPSVIGGPGSDFIENAVVLDLVKPALVPSAPSGWVTSGGRMRAGRHRLLISPDKWAPRETIAIREG
jgi:hypothetical protein